jgi:NAD(P)-dependent dehydrogenase (short-subunit alcohol dehydrogenase family)
MNGKVCIVTGATSGIGAETAKQLAQRGATVIVVGRNAEKSAGAVAWIKQQSDNTAVDYLLADLSSQRDIRALAQQFKDKYARLDVLVNNAGGFWRSRQESVDGIEMTFAVNHLSYFLLTNLLLDTLIASAPARIVNVSSNMHRQGALDFDDLQSKRHYDGWTAYNNSKLMNVLFTYELARRLSGTRVTANALHPGVISTNLMTANDSSRTRFDPASTGGEQGARTSVYLASSPEVEGVTGKYFVASKAVASSPASYDEDAARRLWQVSAEMTGIKNDDSRMKLSF